VASPPQILAARERAVDRMYRALLGDLIGSPGLAEAADLAREAALAARTAGRPLAAANADLPWPGEPHLVLWHAINVPASTAATGHIAALQVAGLDPCEALVSFAAIGAAPDGGLCQPRLERGRMVGGPGPAGLARMDRCRGHRPPSAAGTAGMRSNGAPTGWPTPHGGRWPRPRRAARRTEPAPSSAPPSSPGLLPRQSTLGIGTCQRPPRALNRPATAPPRNTTYPPDGAVTWCDSGSCSRRADRRLGARDWAGRVLPAV
jgi:hypothetical protein